MLASPFDFFIAWGVFEVQIIETIWNLEIRQSEIKIVLVANYYFQFSHNKERSLQLSIYLKLLCNGLDL